MIAPDLPGHGASESGSLEANDVLADGRKLSGILVELGGEFLGPCHAVVGIGVNLQLPDVARAAIDQPVTDLAAVADPVPSRHRVVAALLDRLMRRLDGFARDGFAASQADFARRDLLHGVALELSDARGTHRGTGAGVDARGALCLRQGDTIAVFDSAEVTVRKA